MLDFIQALGQHMKGGLSEEAKRRATICGGCPDKEVRSYAKILDAKMVEIDGYVCILCDCPLATKIHAEEEKNICPKWKR